MKGEPPHTNDDDDSKDGDAQSVAAVPKTKKTKAEPDGGMEPEPT